MNASLKLVFLIFLAVFSLVVQTKVEAINCNGIDGVVGLGKGPRSLPSQLSALGLVKNIVVHCLGEKGGYLFIGEKEVHSSGITWTPMLPIQYYAAGPVDLLLGGKPTGVKGQNFIFRTGSNPFTYFNSAAYKTVVYLLSKDLIGKPLKRVEHPHLSVCWAGTRPFKSLSDVKSYFKPLQLSFRRTKNSHFQLPLNNYLLISQQGTVCLGILNGGTNNVLGDISMLDKLVIFDNEKQQIGWSGPVNCDKHP